MTAVLCGIGAAAESATASAGIGAAVAGGAALLAPVAVLAVGAAIIAYPFTYDEHAEVNRQKLARGMNFALQGGEGYVWTGGSVPTLGLGCDVQPNVQSQPDRVLNYDVKLKHIYGARGRAGHPTSEAEVRTGVRGSLKNRFIPSPSHEGL